MTEFEDETSEVEDEKSEMRDATKRRVEKLKIIVGKLDKCPDEEDKDLKRGQLNVELRRLYELSDEEQKARIVEEAFRSIENELNGIPNREEKLENDPSHIILWIIINRHLGFINFEKLPEKDLDRVLKIEREIYNLNVFEDGLQEK